jgi:hypothetical protein
MGLGFPQQQPQPKAPAVSFPHLKVEEWLMESYEWHKPNPSSPAPVFGPQLRKVRVQRVGSIACNQPGNQLLYVGAKESQTCFRVNLVDLDRRYCVVPRTSNHFFTTHQLFRMNAMETALAAFHAEVKVRPLALSRTIAPALPPASTPLASTQR